MKQLTDEQLLAAFNDCDKVIDGLHAVAEFAINSKTNETAREWVGLTDGDKEELMEWLGHDVSEQVFYAIESKLREKNRIK